MASITFAERSVLDPLSVAATCQRLRLPVGDWLGKANSYTCPVGAYPGEAHLLMLKGDLDSLGAGNDEYELVLSDGSNPAVRVRHLSIADATCVLATSSPPDPGSVYHVRAVDRRWNLEARAYYLAGRVCDSNLDAPRDNVASLAWWQGFLDGIWQQSGLAETPNQLAPEGFRLSALLTQAPNGALQGALSGLRSVADALELFLTRLGLTVWLEPETSRFRLMRLADVGGELARFLSTADKVVRDAPRKTPGKMAFPARVYVRFPWAQLTDGWNPDVSYCTIAVDCPADLVEQGAATSGVVQHPGKQDGTSVILEDDLYARWPRTAARYTYGSEVNDRSFRPTAATAPEPANYADLQSRAAERAGQYYDLLRTLRDGVSMRFANLLPGSGLPPTVEAVRWGILGGHLSTELIRVELPQRNRLLCWQPNTPDLIRLPEQRLVLLRMTQAPGSPPGYLDPMIDPHTVRTLTYQGRIQRHNKQTLVWEDDPEYPTAVSVVQRNGQYKPLGADLILAFLQVEWADEGSVPEGSSRLVAYAVDPHPLASLNNAGLVTTSRQQFDSQKRFRCVVIDTLNAPLGEAVNERLGLVLAGNSMADFNTAVSGLALWAAPLASGYDWWTGITANGRPPVPQMRYTITDYSVGWWLSTRAEPPSFLLTAVVDATAAFAAGSLRLGLALTGSPWPALCEFAYVNGSLSSSAHMLVRNSGKSVRCASAKNNDPLETTSYVVVDEDAGDFRAKLWHRFVQGGANETLLWLRPYNSPLNIGAETSTANGSFFFCNSLPGLHVNQTVAGVTFGFTGGILTSLSGTTPIGFSGTVP